MELFRLEGMPKMDMRGRVGVNGGGGVSDPTADERLVKRLKKPESRDAGRPVDGDWACSRTDGLEAAACCCCSFIST